MAIIGRQENKQNHSSIFKSSIYVMSVHVPLTITNDGQAQSQWSRELHPPQGCGKVRSEHLWNSYPIYHNLSETYPYICIYFVLLILLNHPICIYLLFLFGILTDTIYSSQIFIDFSVFNAIHLISLRFRAAFFSFILLCASSSLRPYSISGINLSSRLVACTNTLVYICLYFSSYLAYCICV